MSDTLIFRYTVVEGDNTHKFDVLDTRTSKRQRFSTALVRPPAAEVTPNLEVEDGKIGKIVC